MRSLFIPLMILVATAAPAAEPAAKPAPSPGEIVAAAPVGDWVEIAVSDLLVMDLAPDARGKARRVVIQLMPAPFSQGWIGNIRKLAAAHWYDGISINRVQDNYVVQWGDADGEDKAKAKPLPPKLSTIPETEYLNRITVNYRRASNIGWRPKAEIKDVHGDGAYLWNGWPFAYKIADETHSIMQWPVHCYGMVGVGRDLPPNTGSGAELYTVIGHAPRHLDRNIALVGRVIAGIEYLSSLPRGTEALGFYKTAEERTPILSVRIATDLPAAEQPHFQYLSTESASFARYANARANRRDPFFITPAGGADICNIPVPIRKAP